MKKGIWVLKPIIVTAAALACGVAGATNYTWKDGIEGDWHTASNWTGGDGTTYPQSGDTATFNSAATVMLSDTDVVDSLVLNARVLFTSADNKQHNLRTKALSGDGKIALCATYFALMPTEATTISLPMEFVKSSSGPETRVLRKCAYNLTFTGAFTGDGKVRFAADNSDGSGATSSQSITFNNDQREFTGTLIYNSTWIDRFMIASTNAVSRNARYEVAGNQAGNIQTDLAEGTLSFGSFYTEKAYSDKSFIRFNTLNTSMVMEIGAANGADQLTLRMGNQEGIASCSYAKLRKVGTGNLDLGETRHSLGTEINGGTVTVVHPAALFANYSNNTAIAFGGGRVPPAPEHPDQLQHVQG